MVELKFIGTPAEVKAEIKEFIGVEDTTTVTEYKVGDMTKKVEETKTVETADTQLPVQEPAKKVVKEVEQVLPTLPTATTEYTDADIQRIAGGLIKKNAALKDTLINTLGNYGVQAITQLPKEHYGAFVQDLIALGADV